MFNGKTNPFIFPPSWLMEALLPAVRRDIRSYKKPFNPLPSLLFLCNSLLPGRLVTRQLTLHHREVLGLMGILSRFGLTSPSHSSFISIVSLSGVATPWQDLSFYFILPIFKRPGCAPGWRTANPSLRTGSHWRAPSSHRAFPGASGPGAGKRGPLSSFHALFSVSASARCVLSQ